MEWKIELIFVPVTDVDRTKEFFERIGWNADHDQRVGDELRFVQMTPPGSACSIAFGTGMDSKVPVGTFDVVQLVIPDADEALAHLKSVGVEAEGVDELAWGRFVRFADPDGNQWTLQELPAR